MGFVPSGIFGSDDLVISAISDAYGEGSHGLTCCFIACSGKRMDDNQEFLCA